MYMTDCTGNSVLCFRQESRCPPCGGSGGSQTQRYVGSQRQDRYSPEITLKLDLTIGTDYK